MNENNSLSVKRGGSGKTTLAVRTALAAQESRERVAVVHVDTQKSASVWGQSPLQYLNCPRCSHWTLEFPA